MDNSFERTVLGRTGLRVGRLGFSASYGTPAAAVERAFEQGSNYFYWGSFRKRAFGEGLRNLSPHREKMVLVVQSYSSLGWCVRRSLESALRKLRFDYADVLLLGMWRRPLPVRMLEAVRKLKERGLVRFLAISSHHRSLIARKAADTDYDLFHLRYNAVHSGAERDIFPHLPADNRPGLVSFTATCWSRLLRHRRIPDREKVPTAGDCYRFVLSNPAVDVCMTGTSNMEQTEHALEALRRGPMSADELAWMRRVGDAIYGRR